MCAEAVGRPVLIIEHHDDRGAGVEVFADLHQQFRPAVAGREDLDHQLGRHVQVVVGERALGQAGKTVERYVGTAHGVGVALRDHA